MQLVLEAIEADITTLPLDAIVNAANEVWAAAAASTARSTVRPVRAWWTSAGLCR